VRLFQWATPSVPDGWHASTRLGSDPKTMVVLRK
jgi:hypothetical protein